MSVLFIFLVIAFGVGVFLIWQERKTESLTIKLNGHRGFQDLGAFTKNQIEKKNPFVNSFSKLALLEKDIIEYRKSNICRYMISDSFAQDFEQDPQGFRALIQAALCRPLHSPDDRFFYEDDISIRVSLIKGLAKFKKVEFLQLLIQVAQDKNQSWRVRWESVHAFYDLAKQTMTEAEIKVYSDMFTKELRWEKTAITAH